jgi:hypothetical protein
VAAVLQAKASRADWSNQCGIFCVDLDRCGFARLRTGNHPCAAEFEIDMESAPNEKKNWCENNHDIDDPHIHSSWIACRTKQKNPAGPIQFRAMQKPIEVVAGFGPSLTLEPLITA